MTVVLTQLAAGNTTVGVDAGPILKRDIGILAARPAKAKTRAAGRAQRGRLTLIELDSAVAAMAV